MNAAVWIIDKDHFVVRSNIAAENLFNLSTNEIIGKRCWEIVHGTKEPVAECPILRTRKTLKRESMQLEIAGRWFEVIVDPILDSKGAYSKAIHIVTDITENKLTQERLERSQRLLANTQRMAKIGGWEWDVKQQKMYWTKELYRIHGFDPSQFERGAPALIDASLKCYAPKDRLIILRAFEKCTSQGEAYDLEFVFNKATGEKIWIRTAAEPVWEGDRVLKVSGHLVDITDFKNAKDELEDQSARIKIFFNSIDDAIFVHPFKKEGFASLVEVNDIACSRYGYTYDEFLKLSAPDITLKTDSNSHMKAEHRIELLEKEQLVFEATHVKKSSKTFPVEINSNILYQNHKPFILDVVRDITNRKRNEEKREKLITELKDALEKIKKLQGLLPICSNCKKIRDDKGYWNQLESYIEKYSNVSFSHGICPECSDKLYGREDWYIKMKKEE